MKQRETRYLAGRMIVDALGQATFVSEVKLSATTSDEALRLAKKLNMHAPVISAFVEAEKRGVK